MAIFQIWSETPISYGNRSNRLLGEYNTYREAILAQEKIDKGNWEIITIKKIYK